MALLTFGPRENFRVVGIDRIQDRLYDLYTLYYIIMAEVQMPDEVLTVSEVAERLGVHRTTIFVWINDGQFPGAYRLNPYNSKSHYRIPEKDVEKIEAQRQVAAEH